MSDEVKDESGGVNVIDYILKLEAIFEGTAMDVAIGACGLYAGAQLRSCTDEVFYAIADMFHEHMVKGAETFRMLAAKANEIKKESVNE
jgi:hypothetical protein